MYFGLHHRMIILQLYSILNINSNTKHSRCDVIYRESHAALWRSADRGDIIGANKVPQTAFHRQKGGFCLFSLYTPEIALLYLLVFFVCV